MDVKFPLFFLEENKKPPYRVISAHQDSRSLGTPPTSYLVTTPLAVARVFIIQLCLAGRLT
jgi:hypothetical protein